MIPVELKGQDYLVYFEDTEELSYETCNALLRTLRNRFPNKTFIGIIKGIEFEELDDEDISNFIQLLTEIQKRRKFENQNIISQEIAKTVINNEEGAE